MKDWKEQVLQSTTGSSVGGTYGDFERVLIWRPRESLSGDE